MARRCSSCRWSPIPSRPSETSTGSKDAEVSTLPRSIAPPASPPRCSPPPIITHIAPPRLRHSLLLETRPNPSRGDLGGILPALRPRRAPALPARDLATHDVRRLPRPANPPPPPSPDLLPRARPPARVAHRARRRRRDARGSGHTRCVDRGGRAGRGCAVRGWAGGEGRL